MQPFFTICTVGAGFNRGNNGCEEKVCSFLVSVLDIDLVHGWCDK